MKDIADRAGWDVMNQQEHKAVEKIVEENLPNLRYLDLSYSGWLIEMPDLTGVPRLRCLNLEGCIKIMWIHPSIGILRELVSLNLRNCKNLFLDLNIIFGLNSLESVNLSGCTKLLNNGLLKKPREAEHSENVDQNRSAIQLSTSSVYQIVIRGTQIPRWFSNQNVGSSISMDLSSVMEDPNWMGVACCALLAAHDDPTNLKDKWQFYYGGDIGYVFQDILPNIYWVLPILLNNDLVTGGIDHLFILFASAEHIINDHCRGEMHDPDKIVFKTRIDVHPKDPLSLGLLWTRNWHVCQAAVEKVLRGGMLNPMLELLSLDAPTANDAFEREVTCIECSEIRTQIFDYQVNPFPALNARSLSMNSEESVTTTTCLESGISTFVSTLVVGFVTIYLTPLVNNVFFYLTVAFFLFYICLAYDSLFFPYHPPLFRSKSTFALFSSVSPLGSSSSSNTTLLTQKQLFSSFFPLPPRSPHPSYHTTPRAPPRHTTPRVPLHFSLRPAPPRHTTPLALPLSLRPAPPRHTAPPPPSLSLPPPRLTTPHRASPAPALPLSLLPTSITRQTLE
ncbi:hypothetical protein Fmac_021442 [Flemingia macrophylla]|uniref:C-JID domain-containing protein n=1 Tax=Flemingia macrophylla TaxID=520843 RepID=A0ABD1LWY1_9FABA